MVNYRKVFTYIFIFILLIGVQDYFHSIDDNFIEKEGFKDPKVINLRSSNVEPSWNYTIDNYVRTVAISEDGAYIVVGGYDKKVYLFQNSSSIPIWNYTASDDIMSVAISQKGDLIVAGAKPDGSGTSRVYLFHKSSSIPLWTYSTNSDWVRSVAISANGQYIVAGTDRVILFHNSSSTPLWIDPTGGIQSVAISDDGNYIVAGGGWPDTYVFLYHKSSVNPLWTYSAGQIWEVAISSSGDYIVAGSSDNHVYYFNKANPTPIWIYSAEESVWSVSISKNERYIATGTQNNKVYLFENTSSIPLWEYETGGLVRSVKVSDNGHSIIVGSEDNNIYFFNYLSNEPLWICQTEGNILSVDISSNGNHVVAGSLDYNVYYFFNPNIIFDLRLNSDADNPEVDGYFNLFWNNITSAKNYSVYYHTSYISNINSSVTLIEQGITSTNYTISGLSNGIHYFKVLAFQDYTNVSSNCIYVTVVDENNNPMVYIENYNSELEFLVGSLQVNATVTDNYGIAKVQIKISRSDQSVVGLYNMSHLSGDFYTKIWNTTNEFPGNYTFTIIAEDIWGNINDTESRLFQIINTHQKIPEWTSLSGEWISDEDMSLNGDYIAVGSNNNIYLFNRTSSTPLWSYSSTYGGRNIAISSNGSYIAAGNGGGGSGKLFLFHKSSPTPLWTYNAPDSVLAVAISSNGEYIAIGSYDYKIRLFHRSSSTPIWTYSAAMYISHIDISSDGNYIVGGAGSAENREKIYLFEKSSSTPLWTYTMSDPIFSITISLDGNHIIAGSGGHDNKLYLFNKISSTPVWTFSTGSHSVKSVKISTDNNYIVAGIENGGGKVYLFNRSSPTPLWSYTTGVNPHLNSVDISSDGSYIIAGNWEYHILDEELMDEIDYGNIYLFHKSSSTPLWHYRTGTYVSSVSISADGFYCVGGSSDGIHFFENDFAPSSFILSSDAENPDTDGIFNLNWTNSDRADNYSLYTYDKYITEINGSLSLLSDQMAVSPYEINVNDGTYYYIVVAHNNYGDALSNCIEIVVQTPDTDTPTIFINKPGMNDLFGFDAPSYNITILEGNLDSVWYRLNNGTIITNNITINFWDGFLEQDIWDAFGNGTVFITFYANNTFGNESSKEIMVRKDIITPIISIISPLKNLLCGSDPPDFELLVIEPNIESMWYSLDSGATNITYSSMSGTIDQAEWNKLGNGTVTIRFSVKDKGGNEGFAKALIRKDIIAPIITIDSPVEFELFGTEPPEFDLSILEANLDAVWYSLDGGTTNYLFTELTGQIDDVEWAKYDHGIVLIQFYVRDKAGNEAYGEIQVNKDLITPVITINAPQIGDVFEDYAPIYSISIEETNLNSYWYSLDGGTTNFTISEVTGVISESVWNGLPNGHLTLTFYAKDETNNIGQSSVLITKNSPEEPTPPPLIPGYDLYLLLGVFSVISTILIRKRLKS